MRITMDIAAYNQRRYGKPWIAVVASWSIGGRPELRWGAYIGSDMGGTLEVEANTGDIVRYGQKDHRGSKTDNDWATVQADGGLLAVTPDEARQAWLARH